MPTSTLLHQSPTTTAVEAVDAAATDAADATDAAADAAAVAEAWSGPEAELKQMTRRLALFFPLSISPGCVV